MEVEVIKIGKIKALVKGENTPRLHIGISSHVGNNLHTPFMDCDNKSLAYIMRVIRHGQRVFDHPSMLIIQSSIGKYHIVVLEEMEWVDALALVQWYCSMGVEEPGHLYFSIKKGYFVLRLDKKYDRPLPLYIVSNGLVNWEIVNKYLILVEEVNSKL